MSVSRLGVGKLRGYSFEGCFDLQEGINDIRIEV